MMNETQIRELINLMRRYQEIKKCEKKSSTDASQVRKIIDVLTYVLNPHDKDAIDEIMVAFEKVWKQCGDQDVAADKLKIDDPTFFAIYLRQLEITVIRADAHKQN